MNHRRQRKKTELFFPLIGFLGGLACAVFIAAYLTLHTEKPWKDPYVPVETIMELAGYTALPSEEESTLLFEKESPAITVCFDVEAEKVTKNQYSFQAEGNLLQKKNRLYATDTLLESILLVNIKQKEDGGYKLKPQKAASLSLKAAGSAPFICHFLGGIYVKGEDGKLTFLKNTYSMEALTSCYDKGFRVFETRFDMTSDGVLVPFYDLEGVYGKVPTYEEFISQSPYGLTQMDALTLLGQMQINPDMLLLVSMRQGCETIEEATDRYQMLLDLADSLGETNLVNRIIPQFYSSAEREAILALYPFAQTVYVPKLSVPEEVPEGEEPPADYKKQVKKYNKRVKNIVNFVTEHDDICWVSFSKNDVSASLVKKLHKANKKVFTYTVERIDTLYQFLGMKVDGFYTTIMPPAGYQVQKNMMPLD